VCGLRLGGAETERPAHTWPADEVELLRALYPRLLMSARVLVRSRDPEDLVQDALVEVLVAHPGFDGIAHPLGYAKTVMARLAYRTRRRSEDFLDAPELIERLDRRSIPDWEEAVDAGIDLRVALNRLGRKQRACVYLRFLEGLDDRDIASLLGVRPATVRAQISRALARMRDRSDRAEET
jgi:RNA polymerase sigma factor (sigma-70 family)